MQGSDESDFTSNTAKANELSGFALVDGSSRNQSFANVAAENAHEGFIAPEGSNENNFPANVTSGNLSHGFSLVASHFNPDDFNTASANAGAASRVWLEVAGRDLDAEQNRPPLWLVCERDG